MTDANPHHKVPPEMKRLREMLDKAGVEYDTDDRESPVPFGAGRMAYRAVSPDFDTDGGVCVAGFSAILAPHSYGGDAGLLELWAKGMDDPEGWLSAKDVMRRLRKAGLA